MIFLLEPDAVAAVPKSQSPTNQNNEEKKADVAAEVQPSDVKKEKNEKTETLSFGLSELPSAGRLQQGERKKQKASRCFFLSPFLGSKTPESAVKKVLISI